MKTTDNTVIYTEEDLKILEQEEVLLRYHSFHSRDALDLGNAIVESAEKYDRGIAVQIVRESDQLIIFQYVMDDKKERNLKFCEMKRKTVLSCGHSSAWAFVASRIDNQLVSDRDLCLSGGGFPILTKQGEHIATVLVSGLHEGKDHQVIIDGLQKVLSIPVFTVFKEIK